MLPSLIGQKDVEVVLGEGQRHRLRGVLATRSGWEVPAPQPLLELTMLVKERAMTKHALVTEEEFPPNAREFLADSRLVKDTKGGINVTANLLSTSLASMRRLACWRNTALHCW